MDVNTSTVEPLFIKESDMPTADLEPYTVARAVIRVVHRDSLDGVQRIGQLWRLYLKTAVSRLELLARRSILIQGSTVPLYEQNPFKTRQISPEDIKDKLTIKNLPLSVSNKEVASMLADKGVVLSSNVKYAFMRDEHGGLTSIKNGDRFVCCQPFETPLPRQQKICGFPCLLFHHGKSNNECKSCNTQGHRAGDERCSARAEKGTIYGFSGYLHPLSNHFMTPIRVFNEEEPFKSIEHALFWKMAVDFGLDDLAEKIRNATHAGVVKSLSKEIEETERISWEERNMETIKGLLIEKARSCQRFKDCLIENKEKILAESTHNKRWGTGLSKWLTECTKPSFWPGNNILGMMLMDISNYIFAHPEEFPEVTNMDTGNPSDLLNQHNRTECSDNSESSDEDYEECEDEANKTVQEKRGKRNEREKTQTTKSTRNEQTTQKTNTDNTKPVIDRHSDGEKDGKKDATSTPEPKKKKKKHRDKTMDTTPSLTTKDCRVSDGKSDIRQYLYPSTGKRKQLETTPEKSIEKKKSK